MHWIVKLLKKRGSFLLGFIGSFLVGKRYYEAYGVKLSFSTPYHHAMARDASAGKIEPEMMSKWIELARAIGGSRNALNQKLTGIIYDVGGFNGYYGLMAAKESPNADVLIFEPDPINISHIEKNIKLNNLSNCRVIKAALTDFKGTQEFSAQGTTYSRLGEGISVNCLRLNDCLAPDLIKIDAAGAESKIIRGGTTALQHCPPLFLQTDTIDSGHEEMWDTLCGLGYRKIFQEGIPSGERCILAK